MLINFSRTFWNIFDFNSLFPKIKKSKNLKIFPWIPNSKSYSYKPILSH